MIITSEQAIEKLMDIFQANPDVDSVSLLSQWGEWLRDVEQERIKASQRQVVAFYTVMRGESKNQSSDDGRQFFQYTPLEKFRFPVVELDAFAQAHNLKAKELRALVEGRVREIGNGWRVYYQLGTQSIEYREPRPLDKEDLLHRSWQAKKLPAYETPKEPIVTDWTKNNE